MAKPEKLPFRIHKNGLTPADGYTARRILERGFKPGDLAMVTLTKPRLGWFNRYAHKIGGLCVKHISGFENYDHHGALKRLQWESNAHCDEMGAMVPSVGLVPIRIPKSLSKEQCSQEEYERAVKIICRHISETYWPDMTPGQVQEMAETMPDEI